MGDNKRGKIFAQYIIKRFPSINNVLDVADGNLVTANLLCTYYNAIVVVDPKPRKRGKNNKIKVHKKMFSGNDKYETDLIIGMHPDEATGEIIDFAINNRTPVLIVPCCMKGKYSNRVHNKEQWVKFLAGILRLRAFDVEINMLHIKGSNLMIVGIPL